MHPHSWSKVARGATYWGIGETPEAIAKHIDGSHSVDGMVFGKLSSLVTIFTSNLFFSLADEKRLKQIITNFARLVFFVCSNNNHSPTTSVLC